MKKAGILLLAMLLTVTRWGGSAAEEKRTETRSGDYRYVLLEDGTAGITDYTGISSGLAIPDALDGHPVAGIGDAAFAYCIRLAGVTIPDCVTSIGAGAFEGCMGLTGVTIPNGVTSIGDSAFGECGPLVLTVGRDVCAMGYATKNNIPCTCPDTNDRLNN